jgi:hypothetical protein
MTPGERRIRHVHVKLICGEVLVKRNLKGGNRIQHLIFHPQEQEIELPSSQNIIYRTVYWNINKSHHLGTANLMNLH